MAKYITQFRFYGQDDPRNSPSTLSTYELASGSLFANYSPITQLGIQSSPDLEFNRNGVIDVIHPKFAINNSMNYMEIGSTGIFELDLEGVGSIYKLVFDIGFLNAITEYNKQNHDGQARLMIDIVYEG